MRRHLSHVANCIAKCRSRSAFLCGPDQCLRKVQAVYIESGFREQMRVPALAAWSIENSRAGRKLEDVNQPRNFAPVVLQREERFVLGKIVFVKKGFPPLGGCGLPQKKTGSRYAPKTSSIAARIS